MNFSEEYIEICKKLPPHEFEKGDWVLCDGKPQLVMEIDEGWLDLYFTKIKPQSYTWLIHRESQWMQMEYWTRSYMLAHETLDDMDFWYVFDIKNYDGEELKLEHQIRAKDPLLACAKAWEATQ